jgi:hypothetical protein
MDQMELLKAMLEMMADMKAGQARMEADRKAHQARMEAIMKGGNCYTTDCWKRCRRNHGSQCRRVSSVLEVSS